MIDEATALSQTETASDVGWEGDFGDGESLGDPAAGAE